MLGISIFIFSSSIVLVYANYRIYKIFHFKVKEVKLIHIIGSSFIGFLISLILIDTLDPISRIIEGLILHYEKINIEGIKFMLELKYMWYFWQDDIIQTAVIVAPVSFAVTLIINWFYKNKK